MYVGMLWFYVVPYFRLLKIDNKEVLQKQGHDILVFICTIINNETFWSYFVLDGSGGVGVCACVCVSCDGSHCYTDTLTKIKEVKDE